MKRRERMRREDLRQEFSCIQRQCSGRSQAVRTRGISQSKGSSNNC